MLPMRRFWLIFTLLLMILVAVGILAIVLLSPKVTNSNPSAENKILAGASLRVEFSREMNPESVEKHLVLEPPIPGTVSWEDKTLVFTPEESWPNDSEVILYVQRGARAAGLLGLPMLADISMSFPIRSPQVLYLYPTNGPADLYSLDLETGLSERLTNIQGGIQDYSVGLQGRFIYFAARSGPIYHLNRTNGEINLVVACPGAVCSDPQVSADGTHLAYVQTQTGVSGPNTYPQVWVQELPLGEPIRVDESALSTQQPRWSSTGWLVYYDEISQNYLAWKQESGERQSFPNQTGEPAVWSPDGQSFFAPEIYLIPNAYLSNSGVLEPMPTSHLLKFELDSRNSTDLTAEDTLEDTSPAVSNDGNQLVFGRKYLDPVRWSPGRQMWLMNLDNSEAQPLTNEPFYNHTGFRWSPDGQQILYMRSNQADLSEPLEIWLINANGNSPRRLVIGGYAPAWTP
jgi:Tol biopolymer transport system component